MGPYHFCYCKPPSLNEYTKTVSFSFTLFFFFGISKQGQERTGDGIDLITSYCKNPHPPTHTERSEPWPQSHNELLGAMCWARVPLH